jgi:uncharacterized protein YeaO (DUF488 family)
MEELRQVGERANEEGITLLFAAKDAERNNSRALAAFVRELCREA